MEPGQAHAMVDLVQSVEASRRTQGSQENPTEDQPNGAHCFLCTGVGRAALPDGMAAPFRTGGGAFTLFSLSPTLAAVDAAPARVGLATANFSLTSVTTSVSTRSSVSMSFPW